MPSEKGICMKSKLFLLILGLGLLFLAAIMMGGCATFHDEIAYYDPNWLTDGRIMAVKSVTTFKDEGLPGYGRSTETLHSEYIVSMKDDGSDEKIIFGGENKSIAKPVASPLGNYIAYQAGQFIKIITSDGTIEIKSIDCGEPLNSFDWSPDETRIAYSVDESKGLYILNVSDEAKIKIASSAEAVAWRVGEKIAYGYLYIINSDGTGNNYLVDGGKPQIMNSGKVLYYADLISPGVYKIKSINFTGTEESIVLDAYQRSTLKLSFDNTKIVGGVLSQGVVEGIWVVNIDGSNLKKLRD